MEIQPTTETWDAKTDEQLASLVPEREDALGALIRRYEGKMLVYVRRTIGGSIEEAEDVVQNIFLKVYVYINSFQSGKKFSSWLYGIAHNECIDHWRRNRKHQQTLSIEGDEQLMAKLAGEDDVFRNAQQSLGTADIRRLLLCLPLPQREVIVLRFLEDRSYEDISDIIKKPVSTVGTLIRRAKMNLSKELSKNK